MPDYSKMSDAELLQALGAAPPASTPAAPADLASMSDDDLMALLGHSKPLSYFDPIQGTVTYTQADVDRAKNSAASAFVRGVGQGASFGLGDELYGALESRRGALADPSKVAGLVPTYDQAVADARAGNEAVAAAHPWAYGSGKVTGGVAATLPMMAVAPGAFGAAPGMSMATRAGTNMGSGVVLGGAQGAGEATGDLMNRLPSAGWGALTGGAAGYAAPIAGGVLGGVAQAGANRLALAGYPIPGLGYRAGNEAASRYAASPPGAIEQRLADRGPLATVGDASPAFGAAATGLAARPEGAARNTIIGALESRNAGTNARVLDSLDQHLGPAPVPSQVEGTFQGIRGQAGQRYGQVLADAPRIDTADVLASLGQRLGTAEGSERAALLRVRDMLVPSRGQDGARFAQTNPQNLHNAKEAIDDLIRYGDPQMGIMPGQLSRQDGALAGIRGELNGALERQIPGYADTNLMASTAHRASEAFESGQQALRRQDVHPFDFDRAFTTAPLERQAAARLGVRADLDQVVGNKANDLQAVLGHIKGEGDWNRLKAGTAFGNEPVRNVVADLEREQAFRQLYNEAAQNSKTAHTNLAADALDVRTPAAARSTNDIAIGSALGGVGGAAGALAVRGARYGAGAAGRRSDIARNDQLADFLMLQGADRDTAVAATADRAAAMRGLNSNVGATTRLLSQALIEGGERNSEAREKARLLSRMIGRALQEYAPAP